MATKARDREHQERRDRTPDKPAREGDILGISDARPDVSIPTHIKPGGGHPEGIEVRDHATGIGDISQTPGATGIDMGGGGEGTDISPTSKRPKSAEPDETD
jgi:hypothetical protein